MKPFTHKANIREFCQLEFACSKLIIQTLEFKVNNRRMSLTSLWCLYFTFKHTSHCVLGFLLLTLSTWMLPGFGPTDAYIWLFFKGSRFFSVAFKFSENLLNFVSRSTLMNLIEITNALQKLLNEQMQIFSSQKLIKVS